MKIRIIFFLLLLVVISCKKDNPAEVKVKPKDFLTDRKYSRLVIEVAYVDGYKPTIEAMDHAKAFLTKRLNKPSGIEFLYTEVESSGLSSYSLDDIMEVEEKSRSILTKKDVITMFIFFADAPYVESNSGTTVLGVAFSESTIAIFQEDIKNLSGGIGQPARYIVEASVVEHELGHTIGLVNRGVKLQSEHQDNGHGRHCNERTCLMYYATETGDFVQNLIGSGEIPELDSKCIADLQAAGGR